MGHNERVSDRLKEELARLEEQGQRRTLGQVQGVNLSSNDYLGLSTDQRLRRAIEQALASGAAAGSTGSRLLSGNSREWEQAEADFALFAGCEAALYFSSGYAANVGLLGALLRPQDVVFSDALNHASIIDGIRLSGARKVIYPHCDLEFLENSLQEHRDHPGLRIIVSESVFSMDGDLADLPELLKLAQRHEAALIIDEAHATGVFGPEGRGLAAQFGIENQMLAIVHTCGKALGSMGAFICSSHLLKQYLVNRARTFLFSTATPPYLALQIGAAVRLVRDADPQRESLLALAEWMRGRLRKAGFVVGNSGSQIIPIILGDNEHAMRVAEYLQSRGFGVRAVRPPTVPPGTARLRISLSSKITHAEAGRFVELLAEALENTSSKATFSHA